MRKVIETGCFGGQRQKLSLEESSVQARISGSAW